MGKRLLALMGEYQYITMAVLVVIGMILLYFPGGFTTDEPNRFFVAVGAGLAIGAFGWAFLRLDRQVSDDPRYQRPVYTGEEPDTGDDEEPTG